MQLVYSAEKNIRGAWVVYGVEGVKQYYGYSKAEAIRLYKESCRIIVSQPARKATRKGGTKNVVCEKIL